jgi:glutamate N-acetyltransferase/amino-acid N-acetyltransferase
MDYIQGSVTAPKGFKASGIHCGIRKNRAKKDLALIFAEKPCDAAAVYTQNKVKGSPIVVTKEHLADGRAQAVICNSGNANTCNADGVEKANLMCQYISKELGIGEGDVIVASTGVIGQELPIAPVRDSVAALVKALSDEGSGAAEEAIMTTDTIHKETAVEFALHGKTCRIGGIAKGSGMIHPNMATMLCFLTTDADIAPEMLHKAILRTVETTFNMVSVDGDTSTNDMVSILASGLAGNPRITAEGEDLDLFTAALHMVSVHLSREIARDGEGASKLLECVVTGAPDEKTARIVAKGVISSSLVKAAMFGSDANWGRVLCAIGYAPVDVDVNLIDVEFESIAGSIKVCEKGRGIDFSENDAASVLMRSEVKIIVSLHAGECEGTAWGCDLTYDYVKINGDYRT